MRLLFKAMYHIIILLKVKGHPNLSTCSWICKTCIFGEMRGQRNNMLIPYNFNILTYRLSYSWQILHERNVDIYTFKLGEMISKCLNRVKLWKCCHFLGGGGDGFEIWLILNIRIIELNIAKWLYSFGHWYVALAIFNEVVRQMVDFQGNHEIWMCSWRMQI